MMNFIAQPVPYFELLTKRLSFVDLPKEGRYRTFKKSSVSVSGTVSNNLWFLGITRGRHKAYTFPYHYHISCNSSYLVNKKNHVMRSLVRLICSLIFDIVNWNSITLLAQMEDKVPEFPCQLSRYLEH